MPVSQLVFFAGWLALAMLGAVLLLYVWRRLTAERRSG
jgi:hypothetical protein